MIIKKNLVDSYIINYLINQLMIKGKKYIVKKSIINIYNKVNINDFLNNIIDYKPNIELKNIRLGANMYKIPIEIKEKRRYFIYMKWLKENIKLNKINLSNNLIININNIISNKSNINKIRKELNKEVLKNRLYMTYRW